MWTASPLFLLKMLLTHCLCDKNEVVNFINATFADESVNIVIMILYYYNVEYHLSKHKLFYYSVPT